MCLVFTFQDIFAHQFFYIYGWLALVYVYTFGMGPVYQHERASVFHICPDFHDRAGVRTDKPDLV